MGALSCLPGRYSFEHWACTDLFVYFAHRRVSLPPAGWIRAAHTHGCPVLGTLIFEWDESKADLALLLDGRPSHAASNSPTSWADLLIDLALARGVQGFLVNVEVALDLRPCRNEVARLLMRMRYAEKLRRWVQCLRTMGAERCAAWTVVWYDSVTYPAGQLAWQDALTPVNAPFFQAADAGFTNYTWARPGAWDGADGFHPALCFSAAVADSLSYARENVFVGVDVFGRNCYGGWHTCEALELIGPHRQRASVAPEAVSLATACVNDTPDVADQGTAIGLSVALFAPGWTWEHDVPAPSARTWAAWWSNDIRWWLGSREGMSLAHGPQPIAHYFPPRAMPMTPNPRTAGGATFRTNFSLGSGASWFVRGERVLPTQPCADAGVLRGWTDEGLCCPKPLLAWPSMSYVLRGASESCTPLCCDEAATTVTTDLDESDAWSGTTSLRVSVQAEHLESSDATLTVPLIAVSLPERDTASRTTTLRVRITVKGADVRALAPCVVAPAPSLPACTGDSEARVAVAVADEGPRVEGAMHGWHSVEADIPVSRHNASAAAMHIGVQLRACGAREVSVRVGQVDVGTFDAHVEENVVHEGTWEPTARGGAVGRLAWHDFAPWACGYDLLLLTGGTPRWLGTASALGGRTCALLRDAAPGAVVEIRAVGAWDNDPMALVCID
ncbi:mannosyl-glycoprotein endo-beta-N-acetylglucosaminidase [Malassezia sp. CBS 17886]|nr:mannosyl-glycoprotein endo-beta-N-acetylglucosaminidase [Malassezia sp. CBS 17886]